MSSLGGQWRVLRHYLSGSSLQGELDKLLQRLRPTEPPENWDNLLKKFEKMLSTQVSELPAQTGTKAPVVTEEKAVEAPSKTAGAVDGKGNVERLAPSVETNSLPSHVKDISWEGLLQGLRRRKELQLGSIQPSWKTNKPIVSKTSIASRTQYVVSAVEAARAPACVLTRAEDLARHLRTYPDHTEHAVRAGAVRALLRARSRLPPGALGDEARDAISEALSLAGWVGPVRGRSARVLSLDGGGVRGLATLAILKALSEYGARIEDMFDLVTGVSTGAIIAGIIASGVGDLDTASRLYVTLSKEMFGNTSVVAGGARLVWSQAYYDTEAWEKLLKERYGDVTLTQCGRGRPRLALVSAARGAGGRAAPFLFRSHRAPAEPRDAGTCVAPLWAAVRASAAAPTYFAEYSLGGATHSDGGLLVNNPAGLALREARALWPRAGALLVSVGTGRAPPAPPAGSWRDKFNIVLDSATDTESVHYLLHDLLPPDSYFRFNPPLTEPCAMDEIQEDKIKHMMDDTHAYIRRNQAKLERAAKLLTRPRSLLQRCGDVIHEKAIITGFTKN